jgi:hypothetical protein
MALLVLLFGLQTWAFMNEMDYYDQNMDAFYQVIEGQDARFQDWKERQKASILQTQTPDLEALTANRYNQMLSYVSPTALLAPPIPYNLYSVPESFLVKPKNPYENYYRAYPQASY